MVPYYRDGVVKAYDFNGSLSIYGNDVAPNNLLALVGVNSYAGLNYYVKRGGTTAYQKAQICYDDTKEDVYLKFYNDDGTSKSIKYINQELRYLNAEDIEECHEAFRIHNPSGRDYSLIFRNTNNAKTFTDIRFTRDNGSNIGVLRTVFDQNPHPYQVFIPCDASGNILTEFATYGRRVYKSTSATQKYNDIYSSLLSQTIDTYVASSEFTSLSNQSVTLKLFYSSSAAYAGIVFKYNTSYYAIKLFSYGTNPEITYTLGTQSDSAVKWVIKRDF